MAWTCPYDRPCTKAWRNGSDLRIVSEFREANPCNDRSLLYSRFAQFDRIEHSDVGDVLASDSILGRFVADEHGIVRKVYEKGHEEGPHYPIILSE